MPQGTVSPLKLEQTERAVSELAPQTPCVEGWEKEVLLGRLRGDSPVIKFGEPREELRGKVW